MRKLFGILLVVVTGVGPTWATDRYVNADGVCGGSSPCYTTIQAAINAASSGDTIHIAAGTYGEALSVNKALVLEGAGQSVTTITQGVAITAAAGSDRVVLRDLAVSATTSPYIGDTVYAIRIDASAGNTAPVTLSNVRARSPLSASYAYGAGLFITPNNNIVNDVVVENCTLDGSWSEGIFIKDSTGTAGSVTNVTLTNSTFNDNDAKGGTSDYGFGIYILAGNANPSLMVDGLAVTDCQFNGHWRKGMYTEALKNATFTRVTVTGSGREGIDLNLKWDDYTGFVFDDCHLIGNNTTAGGYPDLHIKGRNDGSTYGLNPASVADVSVTSGTIGLASFGNNILNGPTISHSSIALGVVNYTTTGVTVDAAENYWGTTDGAVIATKVSGAVDYTPWCNADFSFCGLAASVTTTYVDDDYAGLPDGTVVTWPAGSGGDPHLIGYDAFATIQGGIDGVSGSTVYIADGEYVENIIVDKSVALLGAGPGTLIYPAVSDVGGTGAPSFGNSQVIVVAAHNVEIADLTIDGDNPDLHSGVVINTADIDARNGIIEADGPWDGLYVHDCTVQNIYLRGIYARSGGTGFHIQHNTVQNVAGCANSIAIFNFGGSGMIENNAVTLANDAISANWSRGTQFLNNTVTASGSGVHTDSNGGSGGVADVLSGNQVSDSSANGYGLWVFFPYLNTQVTGNTVSNCDVGLFAWGGSGGTATFSGNHVDGESRPNSIGAYITTGTDAWASWQSNVTASFASNTVQGVAYGFIFETDEITPFYSATVTSSGDSFNGTAADIGVSGLGAFASTGLSGDTVYVFNPGTIQVGINVANVNGTVTVAPGTFHERLSINKSLSLLGAQDGVDPTPTGARANPALESVVDLVGVPLVNPNVLLDIAPGINNVTISGFTLNGSQVFNWADEAVIRARGGTHTNVEDNILDGYYGVVAQGAADDLSVQRNRVVVNKAGAVVQTSAARASVADNRLSPGLSPAGDCQAIYIAGTTDSVVSGNTATGFVNGTGLQGSGHTRLLVSGNTFTGCLKGISIWGTTTFVTITHNTITGSGQHGIDIKGDDLTIDENTITGNAQAGVRIAKHQLNTERVGLRHNDLGGNGTYGLLVEPAVSMQVDAEENYWGTITPAGVAAEVTGNADYSPWCDATFTVCTMDPSITDTYADINYDGLPVGTLVNWPADGAPGPYVIGYDAFATIQAAIDAVTGSTVYVAPGTYYENLLITKALQLYGSGSDVTIVDTPTAYHTLKIKGNASPALAGDVLVQGLTFKDSSGLFWCVVETDHIPAGRTLTFVNNTIGRADGYGWWDYHSHGNLVLAGCLFTDVSYALQLEGWDTGTVTIEDNEFTALHLWMDAGITDPDYPPVAINPFTYGTNCTNPYRIRNNYLHDYTDEGNGIVVNGGYPGQTPAKYTDVAISGNTISNIGTTAIRLRNYSPSGQDPAGGVWNASVTQNAISGCAIAFYNLGDNPGTTVSGNSLAGNTLSVKNENSSNVVNASANWWGSSDAATLVSLLSGSVDYTPWLDSGTDMSTDPGFQGSFSALWVDDDSPQTSTVGRIQEGITLVSGSTVNVLPGLYEEYVVVNKSISLLGPTANVSKVGYAVPANYAWDTAVEAVISNPTPQPTIDSQVVDIAADNVVFKGFVVQSLNAPPSSANDQLLRINAVPRGIRNGVVVQNNVIGPNTNVTAQTGTNGRMGLYFASPSYPPGGGITNTLVSGNKIFDCRGNGNNVFVWGSAAAYGSPGLADYSGTVIEDNEIYGSHRSGIEIAGGVYGLTIRSNTIYGNSSQVNGAAYDANLKWGNGIAVIRMGGDKTNCAVPGADHLLISLNTIRDNEKNGIYFGPINSNHLLTGNTFTGNGQDGVRVDLDELYYGGAATPCTGVAANIAVTGGTIAGNGGGAAVIDTPTNGFVLDATGVYWGSADGPLNTAGTYEVASGDCGTGTVNDMKNVLPTGRLGDVVSENVDYCPWTIGATCTLTDSDPDTCYRAGDTLTVDIVLTAATEAISGGQWWIQFNETYLTWVGATGQAPWNDFTLINPGITPPSNVKFIAVGDNSGPPLGAASGTMCRLTFTVKPDVAVCGAANLVQFTDAMPGLPPSRLSGIVTETLYPALINLGTIQIDSQAPAIAGSVGSGQLDADCVVDVPVTVTVTDNCGVLAANVTYTISSAGCTFTDNTTKVQTDATTVTISGAVTINAHDSCTATVTIDVDAHDCAGNNATHSTSTGTWTDVTAPVLAGYPTPAEITVECNAVPTAPTVTATDNCDTSVPVVYTETRTDGACPDTYTLTRTWAAEDNCHNAVSYTQTIHVQDMTAPAWLTFPSNRTQNADAGLCTAVLVPAIVPPTASDNCDASVQIDYRRSDRTDWNEGLTDPYPSGTTTITWKATDNCGHSITQNQTVTINAYNELVVTVAYEGGAFAASFNRCITFEFDPGPTYIKEVLTFNSSGVAGPVTLLVPCHSGAYTCIRARDDLHTLWAVDSAFGKIGTQYVANFTGSNRLVLGNLNQDPWIDVLDFGIYVIRYGSHPPVNVNCSYTARHPDFNGDGTVESIDFSFIQTNFLATDDPGCSGTLLDGGRTGPVTRIAVADLARYGLAELAAADLNGDGWLDEYDIVAFANGALPRPPKPLPVPHPAAEVGTADVELAPAAEPTVTPANPAEPAAPAPAQKGDPGAQTPNGGRR